MVGGVLQWFQWAQLESKNGCSFNIPGISVNKVYNMFAEERYMCFKPCGELLYCKKWAESLTPGNKLRFLISSRVENFFWKSPSAQPSSYLIGF